MVKGDLKRFAKKEILTYSVQTQSQRECPGACYVKPQTEVNSFLHEISHSFAQINKSLSGTLLQKKSLFYYTSGVVYLLFRIPALFYHEAVAIFLL